jgi:hypothetical protein
MNRTTIILICIGLTAFLSIVDTSTVKDDQAEDRKGGGGGRPKPPRPKPPHPNPHHPSGSTCLSGTY